MKEDGYGKLPKSKEPLSGDVQKFRTPAEIAAEERKRKAREAAQKKARDQKQFRKLSDVLVEICAEEPQHMPDIARVALARAKEGDINWAKFVRDTTEGTPKQSVDLKVDDLTKKSDAELLAIVAGTESGA